MRNGWEPWLSTMGTNVAIAVIVATLIWFIGIKVFLLVQLPIPFASSTWLFYVQHQFERTFWAHEGEWTLRAGFARKLALRLPSNPALVHRQHRRSPCPPLMQPDSLLPSAASAP